MLLKTVAKKLPLSQTAMMMMLTSSKVQMMALPCVNCRGIKMSSRMTLSSIEDYFSQDEKESILRIVNETTGPEDFSRYVISKKKIEELVKVKNASGIIKNLEELITIVGLKVSVKCNVHWELRSHS
jgi:transcriptional regulatory protein LevR